MSGKDADNMHKITELPAWERLFKIIVWKQIGEIEVITFLVILINQIAYF